jgi:hypothetical protein
MLAVKQSSKIDRDVGAANRCLLYQVALQSKLKWRWVRFAASVCGCVIMMWDMQAGTIDPRELTITAFAIRP